MILTREKWKSWILQKWPNPALHLDESFLFIPELNSGKSCQSFVYKKKKNISEQGLKKEYYKWCRNNLKGEVYCFWSNPDDDKEWWGFTDPDDVVWWLLKWS